MLRFECLTPLSIHLTKLIEEVIKFTSENKLEILTKIKYSDNIKI